MAEAGDGRASAAGATMRLLRQGPPVARLEVGVSGPTPEYRRQHDVEPPQIDGSSFRPGWRVRTRLDQLLAAGRINRAEHGAAIRYRSTWAVARELAGTEPGMLRVAGSSGADGAMAARIDASGELNAVERAIGGFACRLLLACLVHDLAWAAIARKLHCHPETARDWTVAAIRALAAAYGGARRRPELRTDQHSGGTPDAA